ncbi:MAG TPA: ATP-grasp domain-containing protein [Gemmatimonadales bacterium]|nr:ATP-grasp domain-containing protein [Gemmatimonadales bacterium]
MRVFAFEFFSGGGLAGHPLPATVAREGDLMLSALVRDLARLPGTTVVASRDPRLPPLPRCETVRPLPGEDPFQLYARGLEGSDAGWPTAPEGAGVLERLTRDTEVAGKVLLGCRPEAVHLAASKHATARVLREHGVPAVPTFAWGETPPPLAGRWVVKPDDGAGCEDTEVFDDRAAALERLAETPGRLVAQPWIEGEPLSLSLLCAGGTARLLSCNRQRIAVRGGRVGLEAVVVNAVADGDGRFASLGERIAAAVPGLWGYVGVDLVLAPEGPVVLEINPRLTTSYCGLRTALGLNPAGLVLGLLRSSDSPIEWPKGASGAPAEISFESSFAL